MRQRRVPVDPVLSSGSRSRNSSTRTVSVVTQSNEGSGNTRQQTEVQSSHAVETVPQASDAEVVDVTDAASASLNVTNNLENLSPRTDYTYSSSLSYRALSPHKRVGSPNMARRPLHGVAPSADSDTSKGDRVLSSGSSPMQQNYDSKSSRKTTYIHNDADSDEEDNSWRDVVRSMALSATTTTSSVSMTRTVSFGLDYESDGDDFSPARSGSKRKHLSHRATPLLASSHLTSSTANHVPSLLSSPNGRALYATEEQQLIQNRALHGLIDGFSYTVNQLARIPAALTQTLVSLTSYSSARHNGSVDNSNSKNVSFTQDRWSLSNSTSKTPNAVEVKKSPMVLRSRRRVMGRTDSRNDEEVEILEKTQNRHFESLPEDRLTDTASQKSFTSRSAFSFFYTLLTLIVWATSTAASSVYDVSKNIIDASTLTIATAVGSVTDYSSANDEKIETDVREDYEVVHGTKTREETEDMDDPNVRPLSWKDWLASLLPLVGGKRKRRRNRKLWDEHGMDTRSKTHRGNNKASFGVDDITEHDFDVDVDEHDGDQSSSSVVTVVTTVVTTIVETVYDLGFEIEEIGRKVVGAPSRRQERDLQKRLRLAGYKSDNYDRTAHSTSGSVKRSFAGDDDDGAGVAWCCWLLPLLLLLGCAALAGLAHWYGSENVYAAVSSSTTRVTSAVSFLATKTSEFLREAAFSLANGVKYIFWALSYPFVYFYNNVLLWSSQDPDNSGGHSVYDSVVSVLKAGALGVTSIAQSAFTSVLSFCLWVFGGISTLLIYIWELIQVLCSWVASVVASTSSAASESLSSGASKTAEGLWSGLLWSWAGLASAAGSLASLASSCVFATAGLTRSAQLTVAPEPTAPSSPVVLPSSSSGGPSVDDLVALVLQSETLHQQLGVKVSSEVAAQTSPAAAQLLELQHTSTAAQTRTQQLLEQLQIYHDSLKLQLAQLNESLSLVAAEGSQGRADLSAAVLEQKREREQQMKQLQDTLRDMNQQISKVQEEQVSLSAELKSCCQKTVLTLEDVERHVNGLIFALIGGSGGGDTASPADLKAWIGTYFIAKDEMETQMADMMNKLKLHANNAGDERGSLEEVALAQTQQLVMERVTEALQGELSARMQQQVSSQIPEVLEAHLQSAEFKNLVQREVKPSVEAEVAGQLTSHVTESQQFAQGLQAKISSTLEPMVEAEVEKAKSSVVAHLEPQIHSHVSFAVKDRVKEEVRESLIDGEGEGSLAAIVNDRVTEAYRLHNEETNVAFEQLQEQVSAKITGAVQTKELNDTIKVLVAEAIALHMQNEGETSGALNMAARVALGGLGVGDAGAQSPLSRSEVETIVTDALKKYDADRTGLVDHALESSGGSIVSTRCTEAYEVNQAEWSILGIPLYRYATNTPRSIIQPDRHPGQCWAFKGSQGYVVIRLVMSVRPTGFSLEHIPKSIAPFGVIDSAPKNFSMWGLATEKDEGVLLGSYQYREDGDPLQYFPVEEVPEDYFPFIEFKITSNHGNMKYTCVYRVRVHGIRME